jgi:pimeloyl-ACP methyl ester carboxylesterase/DNA-binding CsgD family transcriptional regulator
MLSTAQQIRFCISRDGTRIAYAICGSGPLLIWVQHWLHHLESDWDSPVWRPWLSKLAQRHTLVRFDWRGCALSDREGVDFSLDKYDDDLEAVVTATDARQFALFGMSDGGASALSCAARHPDRVSRLILLNSQSRGRFVRNSAPDQVADVQARFKVFELSWPNGVPAFKRFHASVLMPDASSGQISSHSDLLHLTTLPANAVALIQTFLGYDVTAAIEQVRCPTLVLHTRGNSLIPFEEGRRIAALIPGAHFASLESQNHILVESEPAWQQCVDAIDDFLPAEPPRPIDGGAPPLLEDLTTREHQVLERVAQGLDNDTIARQLGISEKTVRNQVSIIFSKLGVNSRAQAIVRARDAGFGRRT